MRTQAREKVPWDGCSKRPTGQSKDQSELHHLSLRQYSFPCVRIWLIKFKCVALAGQFQELEEGG